MDRRDIYAMRNRLMDYADTLIDFGRVVASEISPRVKNVLATVRGIEMDEGGAEQRDRQPLYGLAGVLVRPAAPNNEGAFEVVFARVGDELVPLASRDVRWQVDLEEGEVVVRSLSETPARIYLKPDGSCIVEASSFKVESDDVQAGGNSTLALAGNLDAHLTQIAKSLDEIRTVVSAAPDPNYGTAAKAALDTASPIPTTKTKGA